MSGTILLTGGTGFLGRRLAPHLVAWAEARGYRPKAFVRPPLARPEVQQLGGLGFELVPGDVRYLRPQEVARATGGIDIAIHLVGVLEGSPEELLEVNYRGTARLLEAVRAAGGRRFIYLSSLGAGPNPKFPYAYSIWLGEREVRRSGLQFAIFRPSVLIGSGDPFTAGLIRMVRNWPFVLLPRSRTQFQPLWVGDLVRCILLALDNEGLSGKLVRLGGPEILTLEELTRLIMVQHGVSKPIIRLPRRPLRSLVRLLRQWRLSTPFVEGHLIGANNVAGYRMFEAGCGFNPTPLGELLGLQR